MSRPDDDDDDGFLSPCEVAERLNVTVRSVYMWLSDGDLRGGYRLTGKRKRKRWIIRMVDVVAFIRANTAQ
jgi:excisionase family DNA binding protein